MKTPMDHYMQLKRKAIRHMLKGDMERYLELLREMLNLRTLARMAVS